MPKKIGLSLEDFAATGGFYGKMVCFMGPGVGNASGDLTPVGGLLWIYTPGSTAGIPVSILKSLAPPPEPVLDDEELVARANQYHQLSSLLRDYWHRRLIRSRAGNIILISTLLVWPGKKAGIWICSFDTADPDPCRSPRTV